MKQGWCSALSATVSSVGAGQKHGGHTVSARDMSWPPDLSNWCAVLDARLYFGFAVTRS